MKKSLSISILMLLGCSGSLSAQERLPSTNTLPSTSAVSGYASDVGVVLDAQGQALEQARDILDRGANTPDRPALEAAIKEMERSRAALEEAKKSPEKLPAAIAAEQSAYQALLKATPREYRMTRSRSRGQGGGGNSGQPNQQQMDQLELTGEDNRYETEKQAIAAPTPQQREQAQTVDRLKQMSRRQQDLNDRLRDLQTALQEARTEPERAEIQRQLKRLRDEERQMLSDVDELRQQLEQSPDAAKQAGARKQLEQTHTDVQRAAEELERQSVSEALAAGSRAGQKLQDLRENLRQQTSSQFSKQMRQLREEARDLATRENQIAHDLDSLNNQKKLDDSAPRTAVVNQLARQQSALTNLLDQIRTVTEQAEATEPLLAKQLYDILRRTDQQHTDSQLDISGQLVERGFLPQASQAEQSARGNIDELHQSVDRAAESVLGSEAEALRYAQKELDDLAGQMGRELKGGTNSPADSPTEASSKNGGKGTSGTTSGKGSSGGTQTNAVAGARSESPEGAGESGGDQSSNPQASQNQKTAGRTGSASAGKKANSNPGQGGNSPSAQDATSEAQNGAESGGGNAEKEQLRQFAQQLGRGAGGLGPNGPITGNSYVDWADRLRDVEQAVDSTDVRNQLATVRERVGAYRRAFRENGRVPSQEELQSRVLAPLALARDWVGQELSHAQNDRSLVPLDRDPVQEKYSELVRKYYENLGGPP